MEENKELVDILKRRIERLFEEFNLGAPKIVIKTELRLIKDACDRLLLNFEEIL